MKKTTALSHHQSRAFQPQKLSPPRHLEAIETLLTTNQDAQKLILEIGAGKGKHAMDFAVQNPNTYLIAIERTRHKFEVFNQRARVQGIANLTPVHADAVAWVVHAIAPASISQIYILYPNPEQHNPNQQWLNMPFFEFLLSRLQVGGEIILATNIEAYIDNAEQQAQQLWCLPCTRQKVSIESQRTHFEVKYLARGEACWQLTLHKPEGYITRFDNYHPE